MHEFILKILNQTFGIERVRVSKVKKGSHRVYYNAESLKTAVVPVHGGKDLKKGTFLAILKQAGIELPN